MACVEITSVAGVEYSKDVEPRMWGFTGVGPGVLDQIRAFPPPRGYGLKLAICYEFLSGFALDPAWGCVFIWSDAETLADNGNTVLQPLAIGPGKAGRWVAFSDCWQGHPPPYRPPGDGPPT
jgi:hypothetical protein